MGVMDTILTQILPSIGVIVLTAIFCIIMNFAAKNGTRGAKVGAALASFFVCITAPMGIPVFRKYYIDYFNDFWNWIFK